MLGRMRLPSCERRAPGPVALLLLVAALGTAFLLPSPRAQAREADGASAAATRDAPPRLVSLNPSLTAILLRLGARETLIAVDDYSARLYPELAGLPRVGGLFDPSFEAVLALRPERVLLVAGVEQQSHAARLEKLGLAVEVFENERLEEVLENIDRLGRMVAREPEAARRRAAILDTRAAVTRAVAGRARPRTLAVIDRSPLYLVGSGTFLAEMLEAVGARNLGSELGAGYPRGSIEWLIAARPELLLDLTPGEAEGEAFWSRWPSLPAVERDRVLRLDASRISLPGPELDRALRELARAVHGPQIDSAIESALAGGAERP